MNEKDATVKIIAALCGGAATISQLCDQVGVGADEALGVLRAMSQQGIVNGSRKQTTRGEAVGPLYWYLADKPMPPTRTASKTRKVALSAVVEEVLKGYAGPMTGLDMLARLAVRGGFPSMTGAVGVGPAITPEEVSELLHEVKGNEVGVAMAIAIACRTAYPCPKVHEFGYPRVLELVKSHPHLRRLIRGDKRSRIRYVLHDAFHNLANWRSSIPWTTAAKAAKMRRDDYRDLYMVADDMLRAAADDAGRDLFHLRERDDALACC